jgi:hypothetical protein
MSQPLSVCVISKAARGDEASFKWLIEAMKVNSACGHFTTVSCRCSPPCEKPTDAQIEELNKKLAEAL